MEASNSEATGKPALSSTKSIDEGFESDPDREQSNTETEPNNNNNINNLPLIATPTTKSPSLIASSQRSHSFDVLQRTDRDGVQHTQITRRPRISEIFENNNIISNGNLKSGRIIYPNPKVSIPRAGASNSTNYQMIVSSNGGNNNGNGNNFISTLTSNQNKTNTIIDLHQRHRLDGKSIELTNSRLAQSTELMLRSGRDRINSSNLIDNNNPSQIALINGKLICINMPVTQLVAQTSSISSNSKNNNNHSSLSSMAIQSLNHHHNNMNRHININSNSNVINHATKLNHNHHQKYISNGRNHNRGINDMSSTVQATNASIAQQVNKNIIQNANSSIYTFYPAEGNISLIPSQYGLKYKSTHLNGLQEQPAPISPWSQSMARHPKR